MKKKKANLNNDIRPEYDFARMKGGVRGKYVTGMSKQRPSQLALALRDKLLVRFTRPFEEGSVDGYVLNIGPRFFLIALIGEGIRLSGFQCFRLSDVRELWVPHKYARFYEAALKKRGERIPKKPPVSVHSLPELLLSANRAFPLVTIHREKVDPDVCHIGRVIDMSKGYLSLLEIGPDARWDKEPTKYRLSEITRVDFGGDYEEALHLVGGTVGR
ncbi:MAG: hypothetical protein LAP21_05175 [Acidobacteriia bacterium]|nr:hypothetical protein [Terriglobia bacterium]